MPDAGGTFFVFLGPSVDASSALDPLSSFVDIPLFLLADILSIRSFAAHPHRRALHVRFHQPVLAQLTQRGAGYAKVPLEAEDRMLAVWMAGLGWLALYVLVFKLHLFLFRAQSAS